MVMPTIAFLVLIYFLFLPSHLLSQTPFYQGKTITIIQGREPGGTGDVRVRVLIPFLQKYIPGNPTVVSEFMPGGGGRKAANHIYKIARTDGLSIANLGAGFVSNAVLGEPGIQYNIDKFIYLGSLNSRTSYVFFAKKDLAGLDRLRAASGIRIGGQTIGHENYVLGRLFALLLDLKEPKFVTGYSGPEIDVALLSGELDARANSSETIYMRNPEWLDNGPMQFHLILEIPKGFRLRHSVIDKLPDLDDFTKTDKERKVIAMFRNFRLIGSPYFLPPGTPKERAEILREAFRRSFKDPEFLERWKKLTKADAQTLMPEEQEQAIKEISRDPEVIKFFNRIAGAGPLPPR